MSKIDLANLLQKRIKQLKITKSELARNSGISRQTLYKLLNADVDEAKLSTLVKVSQVLKVHPMDLLRTYFSGLALRNTVKKDDTGFLGDITYPDNSIVMVKQRFTKVWSIKNMGSTAWINRRLVCVDDIITSTSSDRGINIIEQRGLLPLANSIDIPKTRAGKTVQISVEFLAPAYPCSVVSYWKSVDKNGNYCFPDREGLSCQVKVVSF